MVTDAIALAPRSDGVLFVVRSNQSDRVSVMHAVDQLEYAQSKILGFILNSVELEKTNCGKYRCGRYHKYGYSRESGYGYEQPPAPAEQVET